MPEQTINTSRVTYNNKNELVKEPTKFGVLAANSDPNYFEYVIINDTQCTTYFRYNNGSAVSWIEWDDSANPLKQLEIDNNYGSQRIVGKEYKEVQCVREKEINNKENTWKEKITHKDGMYKINSGILKPYGTTYSFEKTINTDNEITTKESKHKLGRNGLYQCESLKTKNETTGVYTISNIYYDGDGQIGTVYDYNGRIESSYYDLPINKKTTAAGPSLSENHPNYNQIKAIVEDMHKKRLEKEKKEYNEQIDNNLEKHYVEKTNANLYDDDVQDYLRLSNNWYKIHILKTATITPYTYDKTGRIIEKPTNFGESNESAPDQYVETIYVNGLKLDTYNKYIRLGTETEIWTKYDENGNEIEYLSRRNNHNNPASANAKSAEEYIRKGNNWESHVKNEDGTYVIQKGTHDPDGVYYLQERKPTSEGFVIKTTHFEFDQETKEYKTKTQKDKYEPSGDFYEKHYYYSGGRIIGEVEGFNNELAVNYYSLKEDAPFNDRIQRIPGHHDYEKVKSIVDKMHMEHMEKLNAEHVNTLNQHINEKYKDEEDSKPIYDDTVNDYMKLSKNWYDIYKKNAEEKFIHKVANALPFDLETHGVDEEEINFAKNQYS